MGAMQPIAHEFLAGHTFALRDLRFVMRENVVHAAAVNVDLIADQPGRPRPHGLSQPTLPSSSSHAFQSAKSPMCSLSYSSCFTRPVDCNCVRSKCASFP